MGTLEVTANLPLPVRNREHCISTSLIAAHRALTLARQLDLVTKLTGTTVNLYSVLHDCTPPKSSVYHHTELQQVARTLFESGSIEDFANHNPDQLSLNNVMNDKGTHSPAGTE